MMANFDPYHEWLGISPEDRPINYYSLLSLRCFESNAKVISNAADCKMSYLKTFQTGPHSNEAQKILNVLAKARVTLLNPEQKAKYDAQLRKLQAARQVPIPPMKSSEPAVNSTPKRPEPTVKSVAKRPEPQVSPLAGMLAQNTNSNLEVKQKSNQNPDSNDEYKQIRQVFNQKNMLASMVEESNTALRIFKSQWFGLLFLWHQKFPSKKYTKNLQRLQKDIQEAESRYEQCFLNISFFFTPLERENWDSFKKLFENQGGNVVPSVWKSIAEYESEVRRAENGTYNVSIFKLDKCSTSISHLEVLHSSEPCVTLRNGNGDSLYFYPSFFVVMDNNNLKIIPHKDLEVSVSKVHVLSEYVPQDVKEIDTVWKYAKKDGGQDLRYKDNIKLFVQERFKLEISTKSYQKWSFLFGREDVANRFAAIIKQQVKMSLFLPEKPDSFDDLKKQIDFSETEKNQKSNSKRGCCGCLFLIVIILFLLALIGSQGD